MRRMEEEKVLIRGETMTIRLGCGGGGKRYRVGALPRTSALSIDSRQESLY